MIDILQFSFTFLLKISKTIFQLLSFLGLHSKIKTNGFIVDNIKAVESLHYIIITNHAACIAIKIC